MKCVGILDLRCVSKGTEQLARRSISICVRVTDVVSVFSRAPRLRLLRGGPKDEKRKVNFAAQAVCAVESALPHPRRRVGIVRSEALSRDANARHHVGQVGPT